MRLYNLFGFRLSGLLLVFCCALTDAFGQNAGRVEVVKDPQIDSLIAKRIALNKAGVRSGSSSAGFQVQIYLGSDRQDAYEAQNRFKSIYPDINTYISYTEPNYKVQAGDFRSRMDAQRLLNELKQNFPTVIIVPGRVNSSQ